MKSITTDPDTNQVNVAENALGHALVGGLVAYLQGNSTAAGAAGGAGGELAADAIAYELYPDIATADLTEEQKQTISTLSTLAAALAGTVAANGATGGVTGADAGKNAVDNNDLSPGDFGTGFADYGLSITTLGTSMVQQGATQDQINAELTKNAQGDLPEGANITNAIVDGYENGVLIAGGVYIGPAAAIDNVVVSLILGAGANAAYQWYDMSQPGNENKTYDYWSTTAAAVTGGLAPGRGIIANTGIAVGGAIFTDGTNSDSIGGAVIPPKNWGTHK
ncbi:VENN motif pre-toxin domain-containing protein [Sodalis ligni]|uniref:VENN motif pre-toxin domain-containing protein n=1 Tax=Sodalis ligni TaxID=2697027 RepID=UPI001BDDFC85|nr:VENN motif pre-toxin domain-containing protein [Sodalis ligni]QWA10021.1 VENN motif pre-toxin domain-containing protein [Sodalis ligni]